jgi:hypothetical protein
MPVIHVPVLRIQEGGDVMSVMLGSEGYRSSEAFGEGGSRSLNRGRGRRDGRKIR